MKLTKGLIFSQRVMLALIDKGLSRQKAYELVQRNAMKVWEAGADFRATLLSDPEVASRLSEAELDDCFDIEHHLRFVDEIFQRLEISDA